MPKETNLNVAPYFDDFTPDSNYYKVLYKPGFPVQARELTTMQSILQDQIENMGNHFFKEGAKVIPGGTTFEDTFQGVQIDAEFLGIPVNLYLDQLIGKRIRGASRNGLAVVSVERNSCGGCFSKIPPQRQLDIKAHKKVIVCEHCGRILVDANIFTEEEN